MKVLIVLCHPFPTSFSAKISKTVRTAVEAAGHVSIFHDLYHESFNPVLPEDELKRGYSLDEQVQAYMDEVSDSDILVFVHPDWWGQMPALLKGWLDRVFRPGVAFDYSGEEFLPKRLDKLMTGKKGIAYCTTDSEENTAPHSLIALWKEKIFGYCGIAGECVMLYSTRRSDAAERKAWLELAATEITTLLRESEG